MVQNSNLSPGKVIVSAPGKIHLMGEHAVVHGKPALIAAINLRLYLTVQTSDKFSIIAPDNLLIEEAMRVVLNKLRIVKKPNIKISVDSQIPAGRHAGSSAAVSVATVAALLFYLKKVWNPILINELAYEVEKKQHGNPSGGDNTTITFGGLIWYRKELEFLKSVWQLPFKIPKSFPKLYLVDTGRPQETTGEMITLVTDFIKNNPSEARSLLDKNEVAVKEIATAIKKEDKKMFLESIKKGQKTLQSLGVVSKTAEKFIVELEKKGVYVKVCGGGGRKEAVGLLLCAVDNYKNLFTLSQKNNFKIYPVILGGEGVRLEKGK